MRWDYRRTVCTRKYLDNERIPKPRILRRPRGFCDMVGRMVGVGRRLCCLTTCVAAASLAAVGFDVLQLQPVEIVKAGGAPLDTGDYAVPCVVDWNGDGHKDLLVGYRSSDRIALFLNQSTSGAPALVSRGDLQADGRYIVVSAGGSGCGAPAPWACDFDSDGDQDLIVGSGADGSFLLFRNTGSATAPVLASAGRLALWDGGQLAVVSHATPCFADWDGDSVPDLLSGAGDGTAFFFKNIGTAHAVQFTAGVRIRAGGKQLNLGSRSVVRVIDWDGDGVKDIVGSSSTGVYWCRNVGTTTAPDLRSPVALAAPVKTGGLAPINTSIRMRLDVADWNDDAVADLLIGNADGSVFWFEGYNFAIWGFTHAGDGQVTIEWRSAPYLKYSIVTGVSVTSVKDVLAFGLPSKGLTTSWTNRFLSKKQYFRVRVSP